MGLVALQLSTPQPDNGGTGHFLLGRLTFGERQDFSGKSPIVISLTSARMHFQGIEENATDDSMIGVRDTHDHVHESAGELIISGPKNERGHLSGEVFSGSYIFKISEEFSSAGKPLTMSVSAFSWDFEVAPADDDGRPLGPVMETEAKRAVIRAILENHLPREEGGRLLLQRARMWRRRDA